MGSDRPPSRVDQEGVYSGGTAAPGAGGPKQRRAPLNRVAEQEVVAGDGPVSQSVLPPEEEVAQDWGQRNASA